MTGNSSQPSIPGLRLRALVATGLLIVTVVCFYRVGSFDFTNYDDDGYVTANRQVQAGLTREGVAWAFTTSQLANWHPVTWLSHMLDVELFGLQAGRHHLVSLLLHLANVSLLFLVMHGMTGALWQSAFVAALFAVHPLHVESVAWVSERKDVLSTNFWLLTMAAYLWYVRKPGSFRYSLVIFAFAAGLMAKPMLVTLPFVLLLLDYWPLERWRGGEDSSGAPRPLSRSLRDLLPEKIPLFIMAALSAAMTYRVQQGGGAIIQAESYPLGILVTNALTSYVGYIGKTVWPANLAVFYPHPGVSAPPLQVAGAVFVMAGISLFALWKLRRHPFLAVGWFWYVGTLVPVIGLVQVGSQLMADRYTYVPLIGLFIMAAWGIPRLVPHWRHRPLLLGSVSGAVLLALMIASWFQVGHWRDSVTLFSHATEVTSENWLAHGNLAVALKARGRIEESVVHYREALRIEPGRADGHYNLGNALYGMGQYGEAVGHYLEALRINPGLRQARVNLGLATGRRDRKMLSQRQRAVRLSPGDPQAHFNLGVMLAGQGRREEAAVHFSEALRLDPEFQEARSQLGRLGAEKKPR